MRSRRPLLATLAALGAAVTIGLVSAPAAVAGPGVPLTACQMQALLGYQNVQQCEPADS